MKASNYRKSIFPLIVLCFANVLAAEKIKEIIDDQAPLSSTLEAKRKTMEEKSMLTETEKRTLLKIARQTIKSYLETNKLPDDSAFEEELTEKLKEKRAVFVTLKINSQLRGCIGEIFPAQPLYKSVISNAHNAAFEDPRFRPLSKEEFDKIHIEISVLTIPQKIASYDEIVIGRDGIILSKGRNRAVFLPHVATEQGWTLENTLSHLARKAGLPADAWKTDCRFQTFQAEVFGD